MLNEEIPVKKYQNKLNQMSKLGRNNVHYVKVLKLWVRQVFSVSMFNSEVTFDEQ